MEKSANLKDAERELQKTFEKEKIIELPNTDQSK